MFCHYISNGTVTLEYAQIMVTHANSWILDIEGHTIVVVSDSKQYMIFDIEYRSSVLPPP